MGRNLALEDEDGAVAETLAQMVISAAVAEADFQRRPRHVRHQSGHMVEAGALRMKPANDAVEAAHLNYRRKAPSCLAVMATRPPTNRPRKWL